MYSIIHLHKCIFHITNILIKEMTIYVQHVKEPWSECGLNEGLENIKYIKYK